MTDKITKKQRTAKALRTLAGTLVLLIGIITIPYPGPGWLIVFAGLAILARDYPAAQRILDGLRGRYTAWQQWLHRQPLGVKIGFWLLTTVTVILTIWLMNGYGILNDLLNLGQDWAKSPLVR